MPTIRRKPEPPASEVATAPPSVMIWVPAAGLLALTALLPFVEGAALWAVPALMWPLVIGTLLVAWRRPEAIARAFSRYPVAFTVVAGTVAGLIAVAAIAAATA